MTKRYRLGDPYPNDLPTCIVPWTSICLAANGDTKPCCNYLGEGEGNIYNNQATLESTWDKWTDLRNEMLAGGKPDRCIRCWKTEEATGSSRRMWMLDKFQDYLPKEFALTPSFNPLHMDLNFGNTCNLKCRMCGSWGSTHWFKDDKELQSINSAFDRNIGNAKPRTIDSSLYRNMENKLSTMKRIDFKGGEPMMQEGMFEVLKMLVANGSAKNVELGYVTNGTKTPEQLMELWPHFKRITLNVSVEATDKLYQYIRGSTVQTIEDLERNLHWYDQFDNVKGHFSISVSIYNIFDLQNLANWIERTTIDLKHWKTEIADRLSDSKTVYERPHTFQILVTKPAYLCINNMPPHLKQRAIDCWDGMYHSLDALREALTRPEYDKNQWKLFKQFTRELDRIRGTNVLQYIPQLEGEIQ